jgi:hypothetical protein
VRRRQVRVHRAITLGVGLRAGDASTFGCASRMIARPSFAPRQPVTITLPFSASASPIASSDSATARVDEAAGVDDDEVGALVGRRDLVALGAQLGEDALGVDQRLRAAEADEADTW